MKDLSKITLEELKQFDFVYWDGEVKDMDDFLNWCWLNDTSKLKYSIDKNPGGELDLIVW